MIFKINAPLSQDLMEKVGKHLEDAWVRHKETGLPLVVGPGVDVITPVTADWEHCWLVTDHERLDNVLREHERDGWQVCGIAPESGIPIEGFEGSHLVSGMTIVFKRPVLSDPDCR